MLNKISRIAFVLTVLATVLVHTNMAVAQIIEDGLVSYWSFDTGKLQDKTVKDGIGNHGGQIQGQLKQVKGKIGEALEFDGNQENYVNIDKPADFDFNADFTWSAWIKTDVGGTIFAKTGGPGTDDKGPKTFFVADGVLSFDVGWVGGFQGTNAVNDSQWHYVAITVEFNGDDTIQYYIDGKASDQGKMNVDSFPEDGFENKVFIGLDGRADVGEFPAFSGVIDEVSVYNRVLSEAEIRQNSESEKGLSVGFEGKLAVTWGGIKDSK